MFLETDPSSQKDVQAWQNLRASLMRVRVVAAPSV